MGLPVIGICTALERAQWSVWDQQAAVLPYNYLTAIQRAGGVAIMLPPDPLAMAHPDYWLDLVDGLILAGGADIEPAKYNAPRHPLTVDTVPERDDFEIALVRRALQRDIPFLGICRGMQLLNVALGGSLIQDLPTHVGHEDHRRVSGSFDGADHDVDLDDGSLAQRAVGELRHATKSHHHQGVNVIGAGLVVTGHGERDGFPEAIELPDCRFALGVQWHPEADEQSHVIAALVDAARVAAAA